MHIRTIRGHASMVFFLFFFSCNIHNKIHTLELVWKLNVLWAFFFHGLDISIGKILFP